LNPTLNAGSVALQHLLAMLYGEQEWPEAVYGQEGFAALYQQMFGDAWARAAGLEPFLPADLAQPTLELPFLPGERWSLTAGPHPSWNAGTPRGALDFSPVTGEAVCAVSRVWATALGPGVVVRSGDNLVALDLDGDGFEQTGWVVVYYHLAEKDLVPAGEQVALDQPLGHPSCEGGRATGKHVHMARKYNGEWLAADGPLPFVLGGWRAQAEEKNYYGNLVKGDQIVSANPSGSRTSIIIR
jgi:murein DD-endopeptidase MepM/ murein hydrolase activator NlpD